MLDSIPGQEIKILKAVEPYIFFKSLFVKGIDNAYLKEIAAFSLLIVRL